MKLLLNPSRGRIINCLRGGERTVNDLMAEVGLTDNAIRSHLEALEREGLVCRSGERRGIRKPHYAYKLTVVAERIFFEACEPLLNELLSAFSGRLGPQKFKNILRETGRRLAISQEAPGQQPSSKKERIDQAVAMFEKLGARAALEQEEGKTVIRSPTCPWAMIVAKHHDVCVVAEALVSQVVGFAVKAHCTHGVSSQCRLVIQ